MLDRASADRFMFSILTSGLSINSCCTYLRRENQYFEVYFESFFGHLFVCTVQIVRTCSHPRETVLESHSMLVYKVV